MRTLELKHKQSPAAHGKAHGEEFAKEIAEIAEIRLELCLKLGHLGTRQAVFEAAGAHLPLLRAFDADLHDELLGIAEGSGCTPEQIVVLNHYTDLRDLRPGWESRVPAIDAEGGCTLVYAATPDGPVLAQTWDVHGSATPYVMRLKVPATKRNGIEQPAAWLFSITGCLGMCGVNEHGVAVGINNLWSMDARVGIVWPALIRRVLRQRDSRQGRNVLLAAPVGSGHHYLVADRREAYSVETSGTRVSIAYVPDGATFVHTNHCLDARIGEVSKIAPTSTTRERYGWMCGSVAERAVESAEDLWRRLGSHEGHPRSICTHLATPEAPHGIATCGAALMDLTTPALWALDGCVHDRPAEVAGFA